MLTEEELAAMERYREKIDPLTVTSIQFEQRRRDAHTITDAMLRLFPPGHDDPITPERLIACGGVVVQGEVRWYVGVGRLLVFRHPDNWWVKSEPVITEELRPRNMGEVWQLLERLGIPVKKGSEP